MTDSWKHESITPSTRLLNEIIGKANSPRMLTTEEIELLRKSAKEISERVQSIYKSNAHKNADHSKFRE